MLIMRVVNLAYRVEDFFVRGDRLTPALLTTYASRPAGAFLVVDGEAPGILAASVYFEQRADRGWIGMLAVDPAAQGHGLARALIEAVEERCRRSGLEWLELEVVDLRTELPAFYERFGFEVTGRRPFPDPETLTRPADMIVMGKHVG
jgi:GNAT superfamily N-acetyltransferase